MDEGGDDDERCVELNSLEAIFPELQRLPGTNPLAFEIELPVNPASAVTVTFPAAENNVVDSHELSHLPSVVIRACLPEGYPAKKPPTFTISATPPWLTPDTIQRLEGDGLRLWEEGGRDLVAFTYIDHVQQAADSVFGMVGPQRTLEVDPAHKIAILDYDIEAKRTAFGKETFECGVCLGKARVETSRGLVIMRLTVASDPKKGTVCHKMMDCGHIFCIKCLHEFYANAIEEGDLPSVRCLMPGCAKDRSAAQSSSPGGGRRKPRTFVSPSELLQIGLDQDTVKRYVTLKYKTELEADKNTIYCPRVWCTGAARSKKHRRPEGLELADDFANGSDDEEAGPDSPFEDAKTYIADLLAICEECGFAFCSRCSQSWHGEFYRCEKRDGEELLAEEKASAEYLKLHTTPCPTCAAAAQKTNGCNHMICSRCASHFCYLCSAWLDPANPYGHFNKQPDGKVTSCYMRLWELEQGDGDDVDYGFAGGFARPRQQAARIPRPLPVINIVPEIEEPSDDDSDSGGEDGGVGVAREGPLVLRLAIRPVPPAAPQAPQLPEARGGRRGRGGARGAGRGGPPVREAPRGRGRGNVNRGMPLRGMALRGGPQRGGNHAPPDPIRPAVEVFDADDDGGGLDVQNQAWIRRFVQMALNDEEDEDDSDSDAEDDNFIEFA